MPFVAKAEIFFSAGYDLTAALGGDLAAPLPNAFRDYADIGNAACWAVWNHKKPVISVISDLGDLRSPSLPEPV